MKLHLGSSLNCDERKDEKNCNLIAYNALTKFTYFPIQGRHGHGQSQEVELSYLRGGCNMNRMNEKSYESSWYMSKIYHLVPILLKSFNKSVINESETKEVQCGNRINKIFLNAQKPGGKYYDNKNSAYIRGYKYKITLEEKLCLWQDSANYRLFSSIQQAELIQLRSTMVV